MLQHSHHQAPSDEATHEPDLQAEVAVGPGGLPIRDQQEGIGHDADQGERDEGEPQTASTLSCTHVSGFRKGRRRRRRVKVSGKCQGAEQSGLELGAKV